ncbi:MAG: T9SS type A sorting domain-containing protein [Bacteroidales bacterium]|nr:T9SS type A sorting domain-containing protein [Bacteroidales bacterium]
MKAVIPFIIFFVWFLYDTDAQVNTGEIPTGLTYKIDNSNLSAQKYYFTPPQISESLDKEPLLRGFSIAVNSHFSENATRYDLPDNTVLWQLKILVPGAEQLGVVFADIHIPENDKLFIYETSGKYYAGAFTYKNNRDHGILSTRVLPGSELIVEYHSANDPQNHIPGFKIEELIYLFSDPQTDKSSGPCNVNINCPEGEIWQKQKRGVARILLRSGSSWFNCSGSLVNNTLENGAPYFLTADHCGANASAADYLVWQFYFNNEYTDCTNTGNAPNNNVITGSTVLAKAPVQGGTDFKLLELDEEVPETWNPYYNGWSRSSRAAEYGVSIHHPSGDAKKISTFVTEPTTATFTGGLAGAFWRTIWAETESGHGVTEGGSSGSPLFDQNGLIIGTLTGGGASCTNPILPDFYGKFYRHWQSNGETETTSLQPWLDPENEDPLFLYGYDPNASTNFVKVDIFPALGGIVTGQGYYAENEVVRLHATANTGFTFLNWTDTLGQTLATNTSFQFTMPDKERKILANFKATEVNVPEIHAEENILVYPNPATNEVYMSFRNYQGDAEIKVFNITGNVIISESLKIYSDDYRLRLPLKGLKPGIYFINVKAGDQISNLKLIVNP